MGDYRDPEDPATDPAASRTPVLSESVLEAIPRRLLCEVRDGQLFAIPHPNSKREIRRFTYPRDAEIGGMVTGVAMRLAPMQNR